MTAKGWGRGRDSSRLVCSSLGFSDSGEKIIYLFIYEFTNEKEIKRQSVSTTLQYEGRDGSRVIGC